MYAPAINTNARVHVQSTPQTHTHTHTFRVEEVGNIVNVGGFTVHLTLLTFSTRHIVCIRATKAPHKCALFGIFTVIAQVDALGAPNRARGGECCEKCLGNNIQWFSVAWNHHAHLQLVGNMWCVVWVLGGGVCTGHLLPCSTHNTKQTMMHPDNYK